MRMPCIEDLNYEMLLGNSSYQECADYITSNFNEVISWDGNICEKCPRKRAFFEGYRLMQCLKKPSLSFKLAEVAVKSIETIRKYELVYSDDRNI